VWVYTVERLTLVEYRVRVLVVVMGLSVIVRVDAGRVTTTVDMEIGLPVREVIGFDRVLECLYVVVALMLV
jgi:hypothetical protein